MHSNALHASAGRFAGSMEITMADKELKDIEQVSQRVSDAHGFLHIDDKTAQLTALDAQIAQAGFWDDAQRAQAVSKQASSLRDTIDAYNAAVSLLDDARAAQTSRQGRIPCSPKRCSRPSRRLTASSTPLRWKAGSPGVSTTATASSPSAPVKAAWKPRTGPRCCTTCTAAMRTRRAGRSRSSTWSPVRQAVGLNKATLQIEGRLAYGMLRSENGVVHRLVRISPTDVKQRRHTTFAAVEVLPVLPDDIEVNLDMNDVRVDVYRSEADRAASASTPPTRPCA